MTVRYYPRRALQAEESVSGYEADQLGEATRRCQLSRPPLLTVETCLLIYASDPAELIL